MVFATGAIPFKMEMVEREVELVHHIHFYVQGEVMVSEMERDKPARSGGDVVFMHAQWCHLGTDTGLPVSDDTAMKGM